MKMKLKSLTAITLLTLSTSLFAQGMMMGTTYPEDGAMMMEATDRLELNFDMPMKLVSLKLIDSSGRPVAIDFKRSPELGSHFKVMTPTLKPDNYKVHWKAMGDDGHMMKGSYGFMQH